MMLFEIGLRASVVVLAALAVTLWLRHRSAALRYWVVAVGIFCAVEVAPLGLALPAWDFPQEPASGIDSSIAGAHHMAPVVRPSAAAARHSARGCFPPGAAAAIDTPCR